MTHMNLHDRTAERSRGWRRLSRVVSASLAVAAIGSAVYLGATGPVVSPVEPPAVAAAVTPLPAADDGRSAPDADGRPDGGRGARNAGFDQGRRR